MHLADSGVPSAACGVTGLDGVASITDDVVSSFYKQDRPRLATFLGKDSLFNRHRRAVDLTETA